MGVPTVAEGVEMESQREALEAIGCDTLQGHLFSPALQPDALLEWVEARADLERTSGVGTGAGT